MANKSGRVVRDLIRNPIVDGLTGRRYEKTIMYNVHDLRYCDELGGAVDHGIQWDRLEQLELRGEDVPRPRVTIGDVLDRLDND
jgi:hypothetical protein